MSRYGCQHGDLSGDLVIASAHALSRGEVGLAEVERFGPVGLVCVEEARLVTHPRARQAIERLWGGHVRLLGLSGTAVGSSAAHEAIRDVFGPEPAYQKTFREVVDRRFLARPVFVRRRIAATEQMRIDAADVCRLVGMGQDMRAGLLREITMRPGRTRQIVGHWLNHKDRYGRTMIFAAGPEHAEEIASDLSARGVAAEYVHSGVDRGLRAQRVARFRKGYCQVLVRAGLLTESEHFPETQTVMLARPTVSAALYQRMISAAARRAAGPLSPTHFFVVDFVDGIERQGVWLAGREAAADLGSEFEDTHTGVLRDSLKRRKRRERALVSARAWQVLMRFADDQYSVWGELVWALPRGGEKSVVVFNEGVARLRAAVDRIEQTLPDGPLAPLRSIGGELDFLGAVRDIDWQEMLCDCAQTELPPRLEKVEGLMPAARVDACAQVLAELVSDVLAGRIAIPGALARGDAMLDTNEALKEHFDDTSSLRMELMKLYNDAISRIEQVPPASSGDGGRASREEMIDAFIRFAVGGGAGRRGAVGRRGAGHREGGVAHVRPRGARAGRVDLPGDRALSRGGDRSGRCGALAGAECIATGDPAHVRLALPGGVCGRRLRTRGARASGDGSAEARPDGGAVPGSGPTVHVSGVRTFAREPARPADAAAALLHPVRVSASERRRILRFLRGRAPRWPRSHARLIRPLCHPPDAAAPAP